VAINFRSDLKDLIIARRIRAACVIFASRELYIASLAAFAINPSRIPLSPETHGRTSISETRALHFTY